MSGRNWLAVLCLVAGIPLAAYGLAHGAWLLIVVGLALLLVFVWFVYEWIGQASRPLGAEGKIKPSPDAVGRMKDQPVQPVDQEQKDT